jgi:arsenate reductase
VSLPRVLFVCVQNAGRSQLAQALYERRGGEARSAGSKPAERVHPEVVEAMREVGIDIEGRKPRGISRDDVEWTDLVVTMGCGDACPVLPGKRYLDWELPDPSEMSLDQVRKLRDEIEHRVSRLGE